MKEIILQNLSFERVMTVIVVLAIVYAIMQIRPYVMSILENSQKYIEKKIENTEYQEIMNIAKDIWNKVEEDWRIQNAITKVYKDKKSYFDSLLLSKFPALKGNDLDFIRQAISGDMNRNKLIDFGVAEIKESVMNDIEVIKNE